MLLEDVLKEFLFDCRLRKLSERTMKGYKNNNLLLLTYLKREFDIVELEDVNYRMIQSYVDYLIQGGKKESYVNGLIKAFRAYFKYCEQEQYINR